jgi:hypothetical protein
MRFKETAEPSIDSADFYPLSLIVHNILPRDESVSSRLEQCT